jgi:hypothetical protein
MEKLKKAVYIKRMLHNKYKTYRDTKSWELYRQQRNLVTQIKRESVKKVCHTEKQKAKISGRQLNLSSPTKVAIFYLILY